MRLLEDHILDQLLRYGKLLVDGAVGTASLTSDHSDGLRGEQHSAGRDVLGTYVLRLGGTDAGEAHLEDADAVEFHLLTHLEEVLHGGSQLVKHCDDVASLHACLRLDVLGECLGPDEVLVVDCLGEVLAACGGSSVCVLLLDKCLTHSFCVFKGLMIWLIVCLSLLRNF